MPLAFELSFGDGGDLPSVVLSEPDGELRLGGKVDRVDGWVRDGKLYLRVVGLQGPAGRAFDLSAVKMGLDIQMAALSLHSAKGGTGLLPPSGGTGRRAVPACPG